jgi:hypothetical protein
MRSRSTDRGISVQRMSLIECAFRPAGLLTALVEV